MYLTPGEGNNLHGVFVPYPTEEFVHGLNHVTKTRAGYIAKTAGSWRNFPWRVGGGDQSDDQNLPIGYDAKATPLLSRVSDLSEIKPKKVLWDWWNDWNISHVDFKFRYHQVGITYKYYELCNANKLENKYY